MDFVNEQYVRLYTRDTLNWKLLGWEGRAVLALTLRKFDRAGILDLSGLKPAQAVAIAIDMPIEIVAVGVERILTQGIWEQNDDQLIWPKYLDAQECLQSDKQRQRESRARRRAKGLVRLRTGGKDEWVTARDPTPPFGSQRVTAGHSVQCSTSEEETTLCVRVTKRDPPARRPSRVNGNGNGKHPAESEQFLTFYESYPRKVARPEALKAWRQVDGDSRLDPIMAGLERWRLSAQWMKDGGQFIPHPSTWLRQKRWEDEPEPFLSQQGRFVGG